MITLLDVSVVIPDRTAPQILFEEVTHHFAADERVGILAAPGTGKSTLARVISKIEEPSYGHVLHEGRVSWPIGHSGIFHSELTGQENIEVIARAIGEDADEIISLCAGFGGLEGQLQRPLRFWTPAEKRTLAFLVSLAVVCDVYVADDALTFGEGELRERGEKLLQERLANAGLIYVSRNPAHLKRICDRYLVLKDGKVSPCYDLNEAARQLQIGPGTSGISVFGASMMDDVI